MISLKFHPSSCADFKKRVILENSSYHRHFKNKSNTRESFRSCPIKKTKVAGIPQDHCICHTSIGLQNLGKIRTCSYCKRKVFFYENVPLIVRNKKFNIFSIVTSHSGDDPIEQKYKRCKTERKNREGTLPGIFNPRSSEETSGIMSFFLCPKGCRKKNYSSFYSTPIDLFTNEEEPSSLRHSLPSKLYCKCPCPYPKL